MNKGRYQVITYCADSGADDKLEYNSAKEAERAARRYVKGFDGISYEGAIVYDKSTRRVVREIGYFSDHARPNELNAMCDRCSLLGKECKDSTEKVWTGCVYRRIPGRQSGHTEVSD